MAKQLVDAQWHASKAVEPMSSQQMTGLALLLVGVALLIVSVGVAWTQARLSRTARVESSWFITAVSLMLFLAGVALCLFGVTTLVEG
jgi:hypothetical protein